MNKSAVSIDLQQQFWNEWNASTREQNLSQVSIDQAQLVTSWLSSLALEKPKIIEVGCGAGWLSPYLAKFGKVTATDLAHTVLERAALRYPMIDFVAGDFMDLDFPIGSFDVAVTLEVLSHIADQPAFVARLADLLRPGGYLIMATQNRPALQMNDIPPPGTGQLRHWVDRHELSSLLGAKFEVRELCSITPLFNRGWRRIVNSYKLNKLAEGVAPPIAKWVKTSQERAWLGWTLMALARKKV
jgi:2-polyprenyl-3-methyl-5-hydroxy-6-metoxy-1,4-benzoquinol methylase